MKIIEILGKVIKRLEAENIAYMVSGSVAMLVYSVPRMTRDIDIVLEIAERDIDRFVALFEKDFYTHKPSVIEEVKRRGMFNFIDNIEGYKVDFILKKNVLYHKTEFDRRRRGSALGVTAWMVAPEDLLISKLIWIQQLQSEKQIDDIKGLLDYPDLDKTYIDYWCKELNLHTFGLL